MLWSNDSDEAIIDYAIMRKSCARSVQLSQYHLARYDQGNQLRLMFTLLKTK